MVSRNRLCFVSMSFLASIAERQNGGDRV
jgi:hypothetical protein